MRGNVETRLRKLEEGRADATLLAIAGLQRLGLEDRATSLLAPEVWLPAIGQGTIALVARAADRATRDRLAAIDDMATATALIAERAFLAVLDGSCRTPIGGHATVAGERMRFRGMIVKPDGREAFEATREGDVRDAEKLGADAGGELKRHAGRDFFSV